MITNSEITSKICQLETEIYVLNMFKYFRQFCPDCTTIEFIAFRDYSVGIEFEIDQFTCFNDDEFECKVLVPHTFEDDYEAFDYYLDKLLDNRDLFWELQEVYDVHRFKNKVALRLQEFL